MSAGVCSASLRSVAVDDLIGTRYRLGGRYGEGCLDCWGLVMECFRRQGITVPDPFASDVRVMQAKDWILAKLSGWQRGTVPAPGVVVELIPAEGVPAHVGFCLDAQRFVHVSNDGAGVIISRLDREPWQGRIIGFYIYRGDHDAQHG